MPIDPYMRGFEQKVDGQSVNAGIYKNVIAM